MRRVIVLLLTLSLILLSAVPASADRTVIRRKIASGKCLCADTVGRLGLWVQVGARGTQFEAKVVSKRWSKGKRCSEDYYELDTVSLKEGERLIVECQRLGSYMTVNAYGANQFRIHCY